MSFPKILANGFIESSLGVYKSGSEFKAVSQFKMYVRETKWSTFLERVTDGSSLKTQGSGFAKYESLEKLRVNLKSCITIGYKVQCEQLVTGGQKVLSWQFTVVHNDVLYEFIVMNIGKELNLYDAIGHILDHIGIKSVDERSTQSYEVCTGWNNGRPKKKKYYLLKDAIENSKYAYCDGEFRESMLISELPDRNLSSSDRGWKMFRICQDFSKVKVHDVTLVCYDGSCDLAMLKFRTQEPNPFKHCMNAQGGISTKGSISCYARSYKQFTNKHVYPINISIRDVICHTTDDKKNLKDLAQVVGLESRVTGEEHYLLADNLLQKNFVGYAEMVSEECLIILMYFSSLYGINVSAPVTITSGATKVMHAGLMEYFGCNNVAEFDRVYRGIHKVRKNMANEKSSTGWLGVDSLVPISDKAKQVQDLAASSFHGGYNGCSEVGYFPWETYDYDLKNAYPTAMCLVPDIDWENPIYQHIYNKELTLEMWEECPVRHFVGYIRFKFPDSVKFPCIPVVCDGVPVYPLNSEGMDGVYTAGPYIYLALKLGAKVYCERGFFLNTRFTSLSEESHSLSHMVKQLVSDRAEAKAEFGKGSAEELILKMMVCSGYGKVAQNVMPKSSWDAHRETMQELGCSAITNPVSATMITAVVQAVLLAVQNQVSELGYMTCSVTTDGFITDCPYDVLNSLDLFGFKEYMEKGRLYLTDEKDSSIWELKHTQDDCLNFTTRGNISLYFKMENGGWMYEVGGKEYPGVCAHNGVKSGYEPDSYLDRMWLMEQVLGRTGKVKYLVERWTSFRDLVHGKPPQMHESTVNARMDFDMKRKPDRSSFKTDRVELDGIEYEIAHFDTVPFETVEEFRLYRAKKELTTVLRTEEEWKLFWLKIDVGESGCHAKIHNPKWSKLMSCIMGYRAGLWEIPGLDRCTTLKEKLEWINQHNDSGKKFTESNWKDCRKPNRWSSMLPRELIQDKLKELVDAN